MNKILLVLILSVNFSSFAQNVNKRVIDKKIIISPELLYNISNSKVSNSNIAQKSANTITNTTQITDDNIDDIELHAAINPTDSSNIIISWMNMDVTNNNLPLIFKMLYTTDFGQSWNEANIDFFPRTIASNERISGGGDPVLVFDNNGNAYISWLYTIVRVITSDEIYVDVYMTYAKSTDKGATWIRPSGGDDFVSSGTLDYILGEGITGVNNGYFPDKQWMAVNPLTNDLFMSLAEFDTTDNYNTGIDTWGIRRKQSGSTQFEDKVLVPALGTVWASLGALAIDKTGNIHAVYPYYPTFPNPPLEKLMHSVSSDNGATYSTSHFIADIDVTYFKGVGQENTTSNGMYDRLYPSSYIAIDTSSNSPYEGRIYVCWNSNDANYNKKVDVLLSYSDDNGNNWSTPAIVNTDPPRDYGFHHRPTIYVNPDGVVILAWYDNRGFDIPNVYMNNYYYAMSTDGGVTFVENKISHNAWNYNDSEFSSESGIGEYFQILATKSNVIAFYTYFDGEDTEIFYNIVPLGQATNIQEQSTLTNKVSIHKLFPSPAEESINLIIELKKSSSIEINIFNINGKLIENIQSQNYNKGQVNISHNIRKYVSGTYLMSIKTDFGIFTRKFIKK